MRLLYHRPQGLRSELGACKSDGTYLQVPTIPKEEEMEAVEYDVEGEPSWSEELATKPALGHVCNYSPTRLCRTGKKLTLLNERNPKEGDSRPEGGYNLDTICPRNTPT